MKFFSDLGSCYRPPPHQNRTAESCSNHRAVRASRAGHWQPNMSVISEDYVVLVEDQERKTRPSSHHAQQKRKSPPRKGGSAAAKYTHGHDQDHQRGNSMQIVVPMFSPTPFVF